uniref:Uncharacterized protein n=1 Tax=Rhizophora mucronata TaxID=61149 RepID=A0A2P2R116_RHIMU
MLHVAYLNNDTALSYFWSGAHHSWGSGLKLEISNNHVRKEQNSTLFRLPLLRNGC